MQAVSSRQTNSFQQGGKLVTRAPGRWSKGCPCPPRHPRAGRKTWSRL